MKITVAICTYNRCRLLGETLESLAKTRVPTGVEWEVVVVDNRCTDATPETVERFTGRLPVRRVEEPRAGLSHARNRAVQAADGDFLVWTDDDVRVSREWLAAYASAFERWPDADFFGGPIHPLFTGDPPRWLVAGYEVVHSAYPVRELGERPFEIAERGHLPYGANFALPVAVQADHLYDPRLGRSGSDLMGGEETELLASLLDRGRTGRWVPEAELEHVITPEQQTISYLRRHYRGFGRLCEYRWQRGEGDGEDVPTLWGRPRWAWKAVVTEEIKYRLLRPVTDPTRWLPHLRRASRAQGRLMGPPETAEERQDESAAGWGR